MKLQELIEKLAMLEADPDVAFLNTRTGGYFEVERITLRRVDEFREDHKMQVVIFLKEIR